MSEEQIFLRIRLYKRHDADLLAIYLNKDYNFRKLLREALRAYAKGTPFFFYPPVLCDSEMIEISDGHYQTSLKVSRNKDPEVYDLIQTFKENRRNAAIKSILRGAILGTHAGGCINDKEKRESEESINDKIRRDGTISVEYIHEIPIKSKRKASEKKVSERKTPELREPAVANKPAYMAEERIEAHEPIKHEPVKKTDITEEIDNQIKEIDTPNDHTPEDNIGQDAFDIGAAIRSICGG